MKNWIKAIIICAFVAPLSISAQEEENKNEEVLNQLRMEYIQDAIGLSESDQMEFQKMYEAHQKETKELRMAERKKVREMRKKHKAEGEEKITEEEAKKILLMKYEHQKQMLSLEEDYTQKMIEKFSAKTVLEYEKADKEFKRELLKMLKDDKPEHQMRNELKQRNRQGSPRK